MTQHSTGDRLARGDKSAAFSTSAGLANFENDLIFRPDTVAEKYGLTQEMVDTYQEQRIQGKKLPDLQTKAVIDEDKQDQADAMELGFKVSDKRKNFLPEAAKVDAAPLKFSPKEYTDFKPVLDRVLVKRTTIDPNMEELSDGSLRDKKTGFITLAAYREHQNVGHVLAIGEFVAMGGVRIDLRQVVRPGDRVTWGDYNSEIFIMSDAKAEALCDSLGINYTSDPEGIRIIRVQDIRGVETPIEVPNV